MRMAKTLQNHDWLRRSATAALAVALAFAAGQSALAQSSGDLQAQVTSRLQQDAALSGARITATVSGGQITLNGSVLNSGRRPKRRRRIRRACGRSRTTW